MTNKFSYRPHLFTFLERMSNHYELYVFISSQKSYAQAVVNKLNKFKIYIKDVLHRGHCFVTKKGVFLKDLRVIQNRGFEDLVIVDNMVESFGYQLSNGVPILEFKGSPEDTELQKWRLS
jgi:CTD small phosphatase-like protein 2